MKLYRVLVDYRSGEDYWELGVFPSIGAVKDAINYEKSFNIDQKFIVESRTITEWREEDVAI